MGVLIVDPDLESRRLAFDVIKWADRRHRINMVGDGAAAWEMALRWRPSLILCELSLPDVSGEKLCEQLRTRLRRSTFVACSHDRALLEKADCQRVFQGVLQKPPSRLSILPFIQTAKEMHRIPRDPEVRPRKPTAKLFKPMKILVSTVEDTQLTFSLIVPHGLSLAAILESIGQECQCLEIVRSGARLPADMHSVLIEGDQVVVSMKKVPILSPTTAESYLEPD